MTGFNRDINTIAKDTFLYDSFTVNKAGESVKIASVEAGPAKILMLRYLQETSTVWQVLGKAEYVPTNFY
jgi:hypothetical protein